MEGEGEVGLDGAQDQGEGVGGGLRRRRLGVSVRERVRALEARGEGARRVVDGGGGGEKAGVKPTAATVGQRQEGVTSKASNVPIVYPLHYKRFMRRTSSGTPLRPETPLYRSQPDDDPTIHAPRPTRSIPALKTPAETLTPKLSDTSRAIDQDAPSNHYSGPGSRLSRNAGHRISPASFLHGTKSNCVRHGRKRRPAGTRDMVEKGRGGAYIPTGLTERRQMEATSPWAILSSKGLMTRTGEANAGAGGADTCPDCVAELNIKRRELLQQGSEGTVKRPVMDPREQTTTSSMLREPAATPKREKGFASPGFSSDSNASESEGLVTTADLGDGLDAVVVEHKGTLRRVLTNARHGKPTVETMHRLSRDLARVSHAIAFAGAGHGHHPSAPAKHRNKNDGALVLATTPRARTSSIPELLGMIDHAASEIHRETGELAERYTSRHRKEDRQSLLSSGEWDDVFDSDADSTQRLVCRQSIDEQYRALHEQLVGGKDKPACLESVKSLSRYDTAVQTPPKAVESVQPARDVPPAIITTQPTFPSQQIANSRKASPTPQTPPPDHPSLHHSAELADLPPPIVPTPGPAIPTLIAGEEKPTQQTPPPEHLSLHHSAELADLPSSTAPTPGPAILTPKADEEKPSHHNPFTFLNPFHRRTPQQQIPLALQAAMPNHSPKQTAPPASSQPTPQTPSDQQHTLPAPTTPARPLHRISSLPQPYHHAPSTRLHVDRTDPKGREQQQVIRAAMRMDRNPNNAVQGAAAAAEREGRRVRRVESRVGKGKDQEKG